MALNGKFGGRGGGGWRPPFNPFGEDVPQPGDRDIMAGLVPNPLETLAVPAAGGAAFTGALMENVEVRRGLDVVV